jgi:hypothetical protein
MDEIRAFASSHVTLLDRRARALRKEVERLELLLAVGVELL